MTRYNWHQWSSWCSKIKLALNTILKHFINTWTLNKVWIAIAFIRYFDSVCWLHKIQTTIETLECSLPCGAIMQKNPSGFFKLLLWGWMVTDTYMLRHLLTNWLLYRCKKNFGIGPMHQMLSLCFWVIFIETYLHA